MPWLNMAIDSAPCSALIFFILSAMKVNASSQETVAHCSLPRSPLRISGWRSRSGSVTAPTAPVPRGHRRPRHCGSIGLPSNFHSLPSRTWAMPPQRQKHISQKVGIVCTLPPPAAACVASGASCPATAPAPNVAPVICRKRRRVNACVILIYSWFVGQALGDARTWPARHRLARRRADWSVGVRLRT